MPAARFVVRGVVQGVGFRFFAQREARALGLHGRVWNRADGAVELVVEGTAEGLDSLERRLRRGPVMAAVSELMRTALHRPARYPDFEIAADPAE